MSQETKEYRAVRFADDGLIPNSALPLIVYPGVVATDVSPEAFEALFDRNGWPAAWRGSVFTYHHYHSTAHEVLGVARGGATLMLGGPSGEAMDVRAGDAILIPAGVGHKRERASEDFMVVGGYPRGQDWDLLRADASNRPMADENIARVPLPDADPLLGRDGPAASVWRETG